MPCHVTTTHHMPALDALIGGVYTSRPHRIKEAPNMTKAELIESIASKHTNLTKKATGELVDYLFSTVAGAVKKHGRFSYPGFGTFTVRNRKARLGRNPQTGQAIKIKASRTVGFKPALTLKKGL